MEVFFDLIMGSFFFYAPINLRESPRILISNEKKHNLENIAL